MLTSGPTVVKLQKDKQQQVQLSNNSLRYSFFDKWYIGGPNDKATINNVTIIPDPPVKGQNVSIWVNATLSETVTGGNLTVSLKYGLIPVLNNKVPIISAFIFVLS